MLRGGSDEESSAFIRGRYASFVRFATFACAGNQHDAEDLLQEILANVVKDWAKITRRGTPDAYIMKAIVNRRNSLLRKPARRAEVLAADIPDASVTSPQDDWIASATLEDALANLPHQERIVVVAREVNEMSWKEVASLLDVSVGTAQNTHARGMRRLARALGGSRG